MHRLLCTGGDPNHPYALLEDMWREFHPPPETTSIALVARLCARLLDADDADAAAFLAHVHTLCHDFERARVEVDSGLCAMRCSPRKMARAGLFSARRPFPSQAAGSGICAAD